MENTSRYDDLKDDSEKLIELLCERDNEIERLHVHLLNANRKSFGKKSERLDLAGQTELFAFDASVSAEADSGERVQVPAHNRKIPRGRKPLPAELPRRREEHWPEQKSCKQCGTDLKKIGEEITEELEYIPAKFEVIEHAKIKCACPNCESEGVKTGLLPASAQPLPGARPGAGLLTHIVTSKYVDHIPLHRLEQIFCRHGILIARQRMSDWLAGIDCYFSTLWRLLKAETLAGSYVQADETYIKVKEGESGKLLQGYFWAVHAPPNLAFFEYFGTRSGEAAKEVLDGFRGAVQTDAYAGYNPVLIPNSVERIACMAHIRRKLRDARGFAPGESDRLVKQIAGIYKLETKWSELSPEERLAKRQKLARPELEKLFALLRETKARLLPRHNFQDALSYALNQREAMFRYLDDGRYQLDNNPIERQIRPVAIGRKNYLFAGSHDGAARAAVFYSLLATCKLNGVNPLHWVTYVLKNMPALPRADYPQLLPHRWKQS